VGKWGRWESGGGTGMVDAGGLRSSRTDDLGVRCGERGRRRKGLGGVVPRANAAA